MTDGLITRLSSLGETNTSLLLYRIPTNIFGEDMDNQNKNRQQIIDDMLSDIRIMKDNLPGEQEEFEEFMENLGITVPARDGYALKWEKAKWGRPENQVAEREMLVLGDKDKQFIDDLLEGKQLQYLYDYLGTKRFKPNWLWKHALYDKHAHLSYRKRLPDHLPKYDMRDQSFLVHPHLPLGYCLKVIHKTREETTYWYRRIINELHCWIRPTPQRPDNLERRAQLLEL